MDELEEYEENDGLISSLISFIDEKIIMLFPHILIAFFLGILISKLAGHGDAPGLFVLLLWGAYIIIGIILYILLNFIGFKIKVFILLWLFLLIVNPFPAGWEASILGGLYSYPFLPLISILKVTLHGWIYWIIPSIPLYLALHFLGEKRLGFIFRLYYLYMIFFLIGFFYGYEQ